MKVKILFLICLCACLSLSAQQNLNPGGLFNLIDTIAIDSVYSISPGQLSKDGSTYYLGLSIIPEEEDGKIISDIYSIDLHDRSSKPKHLNFENPDYSYQFLQCSVAGDENTVVFSFNRGGGWDKVDLAIANRGQNGEFHDFRPLTEINDSAKSDAYPWLSTDGLRLYYIHDYKINYCERGKTTDFFSTPVPVDFTGDVQLEVISVWLTPDELTMYILADGRIFKTSRKKRADQFAFPTLFTAELSELYFVSGISIAPDLKTMYLFYFDGLSGLLLRYQLVKGKF